MKRKRFVLIITVLFTAVMVMLTFSARGIRNSFIIPNVRAERLKIEQYDYNFNLEDGTTVTTFRSRLAINKDIYNSGNGLYIIQNRLKNGENRTFAKQIFITVNGENETSYFVESGATDLDFFIIESNKTLQNGEEVIVIN